MKDYIINEGIRGREVRLIDEEGKQLGIVSTPEALRLARERGLDLVLVAPTAKPPVCRIADYGKLKYELRKREKEARKAQRGVLKEIKLSPKIAPHDFEVRVKKARECLEKKYKVKVSMFFKGREMAHFDLGKKVIERMIEVVSDIGQPEAAPKRFGKNLVVLLTPR